jgi:hypothetical protein
VVRIGGRPVGFVSSAIRNMVRIVDFLPSLYLVGIIATVSTKLNQRLGDLAAGTVVVREKPTTIAAAPAPSSPVETDGGLTGTWDLSAVTNDDLAMVRRFLERRTELTPQARGHLAHELAGRLYPKVIGAPVLPPETFLEYLSAAKAKRA